MAATYDGHPSFVRIGIRDGQIVKLKRCSMCGEDKVCTEGPDSAFTPKSRRADGTVGCWGRQCKPCRAKAKREARRDSVQGERLRAKARAYHARRFSDPAVRARVAEARRLRYRVNRMRQGFTVRQGRTVIDATSPRVPMEPFREWFVAYMYATGNPDNWQLAATSLGMEPRAGTRLKSRGLEAGKRPEHPQFSIDLIDRAFLHTDLVLRVRGCDIFGFDDLYPDLTLAA